jgi:phosphatidylglycerol---prolipoprotein diacylglyceryl transferase
MVCRYRAANQGVTALLSLLAAAADQAPIYWADLGLRTYLFRIGSFELRYYSLAYLVGIVFAYWHTAKMLKAPGAPMAQRHVDDLFFYCTLGVILGGRLGYATFYAPELWSQPGELLKLWNGGMSFHGGLIGVTLAMLWVSWRGGLNFLRVTDYVSVSVPVGMLLGRLANFVNGELWGRVAGPDVAWAMVFPGAGPLARHPSQLYQAALEGALLAVILIPLFWKTRARFSPGLLTGVFVCGISIARFVAEFYREPDAQLLEFAMRTGLSMGQWLTIPVFLAGLAVALWAAWRPAVRVPGSLGG